MFSFRSLFCDGSCETGRADYKPRCSDRRLYLTSLSLSYFQLSLFYFLLWYKFHFLLSLFLFLRWLLQGRKGRLQTQMLRWEIVSFLTFPFFFQLSLFHSQLWNEFHFLLSFFSVFGAVVAGREGQITNPDAQIGAHYHSQPPTAEATGRK